MLKSTEHDISTTHKSLNVETFNKAPGLIMLTNVKMPNFVGILTFMSRINFMLS